jgi:hypothetical protein
MREWAEELVALARADGVAVTGKGGLLTDLMRHVLQTGLEVQLLCSWSHPGRLLSEAAFARLAGAAPIPASSGQTIRYRLDRSGDAKLNRTLHQIIGV